MSGTITLTLLVFAAISFAGAGAALAVGRARELEDFESDAGMRVVVVLLLAFGATCAFLSAGITGIFAFGCVIAWASYVLTAQRIGVFQLVQWHPEIGIETEIEID